MFSLDTPHVIFKMYLLFSKFTSGKLDKKNFLNFSAV